MDSPMLKNPLVAGTYIEKIIVAMQTSAVNIAVTAIGKADGIFSLFILVVISIVTAILISFTLKPHKRTFNSSMARRTFLPRRVNLKNFFPSLS